MKSVFVCKIFRLLYTLLFYTAIPIIFFFSGSWAYIIIPVLIPSFLAITYYSNAALFKNKNKWLTMLSFYGILFLWHILFSISSIKAEFANLLVDGKFSTHTKYYINNDGEIDNKSVSEFTASTEKGTTTVKVINWIFYAFIGICCSATYYYDSKIQKGIKSNRKLGKL